MDNRNGFTIFLINDGTRYVGVKQVIMVFQRGNPVPGNGIWAFAIEFCVFKTKGH